MAVALQRAMALACRHLAAAGVRPYGGAIAHENTGLAASSAGGVSTYLVGDAAPTGDGAVSRLSFALCRRGRPGVSRPALCRVGVRVMCASCCFECPVHSWRRGGVSLFNVEAVSRAALAGPVLP